MYLQFGAIFLAGLVGGLAAFMIGVPLPFMLGGIFGTACFVLLYERNERKLPKLSSWVRLVFMAVIGTMIGSRFTPEMLGLLPQFWVSALALMPFILFAHAGSYFIMRKLGGFSRLDAYFAALPGGIVDSAALAEEAGADLRIVTAQHFIRIILVVSTIPLLFLFIQGDAVGSLAGETFAANSYDYIDLLLIVVIALTGLYLGQKTKLPVSHMLGPLFLALSLSVTGLVQIDIPNWVGHFAQYMIGTALGAQFSGISTKLLVRGLNMGILAGVYMLMLAGIFAWFLIQFVPADFGAMFVSFAAGGLAEMSLIALSLNFNPIVVALHHLGRILLTVWVGGFLSRRILGLEPKS